MNDAWRYCENLKTDEAPRALAGAALTAYLTIGKFLKDGLDSESIDWQRALNELHEALAIAGHPVGEAPVL